MEQLLYLTTIWSAFSFYKHQTRNDIEKALKRTIVFNILFVLYVYMNVALLITEGFLCIALFWLFKYIDEISDGRKITKKQFLVWGLVVGFFLFHKYSIILYFVPFFAVLMAELIKRKTSTKTLLFLILYGFFGVFIASIIPLGYCVVHNNFGDMVEAMQGCVSDIKIVRTIIVTFMGILSTVFAGKHQYFERYNKRNSCIFISAFALNYITLALENYLMIPFLVILFCIIYKTHGLKSTIITKIALIFMLMIVNAKATITIYNVCTMDSRVPTSKAFYDRYNVNNSNVLYMTEDCGFGTWSTEPYRIKYQWIPARFFASEKGMELLKRNYQLIKDKEFEFVVFYMPETSDDDEENNMENDNKKVKNEYYKLCEQIQAELDSNYYRINRFACVYRDADLMGTEYLECISNDIVEFIEE